MKVTEKHPPIPHKYKDIAFTFKVTFKIINYLTIL